MLEHAGLIKMTARGASIKPQKKSINKATSSIAPPLFVSFSLDENYLEL